MLALRRQQGIGKSDSKPQILGLKYQYQDAIKQLEQTSSAIKSRIKKKGEVQTDEDFKGIKNFPRLCTKLLLEYEYLADALKINQVQAEINPKGYQKHSSQNIPMGALSAMIAKTVSKAQEVANISECQLFVAGKIGEENYKSILDMLDSFKKDPKKAKSTVMVFPGVTKVYTSQDQA